MHAAPALALLAALALVAAQPLPGDSVPAAVRIPLYSASGKPQTLDLSASKPPKQALIVQLYDSASYFVQAMWADPSLPTFLSWLATNDDVTLLVLPTAADAPAPIYNALKAAVDSLTISSSAKKAALSRVLVGQSISNATAAWIGQVAATWPNTRLYINVTSDSSPSGTLIQRLDAQDWWLPPLLTPGASPVVYIGDACTAEANVTLPANAFALVEDSAACTYFTKIVNAQLAGAAGVIVYTQQIVDMTCGDPNGAACNSDLPSIPATMISYADGLALRNLANPQVSFLAAPSPALHFAVDVNARLREIGWLVWPAWDFITWAAQELSYKTSLAAKLTDAYASHSQVQVTRGRLFYDQLNVQTFPLNFPQFNKLRSAESLLLDMQLACNGSFDAQCPIWDYILAAYVCCEQPCAVSSDGPYGLELGRWITPFRRNAGHWLTDVSQLLPLLSTPQCNLTIALPIELGATPWNVTLTLLFGPSAEFPATYAHAIQPLWNGQFTFDSTYNTVHAPLNFTRPHGAVRALFYSVITGHGSDNNNCAEFCVTSHVFNINGHEFNETFSAAGTELGCTLSVPNGGVANQHGTWIFGRDGWCDGSDVKPFVLDITKWLKKEGEQNVITYTGLFNGSTPDPTATPGDIVVATHIIWITEGREPDFKFGVIVVIVIAALLAAFGVCTVWQRRKESRREAEQAPLLPGDR